MQNGAVHPALGIRREGGRDLPLLAWQFDQPMTVLASGPLGGGVGQRSWIINATVSSSYSRMDPDAHLAELADGLGLHGPGAGLLTAVDVTSAVTATDGDAVVIATVGLGHPTWAAAPDGDIRHSGPPPRWPGTINVVALLPVVLTDAALVNAAVTVTEAKAQALWECGVHATGTASDALCIACPTGSGDGPEGATVEAFGGPRSIWGARLARAVHTAVAQGTRAWLGSCREAGTGAVE
jgi:adenosylcobinamide hydrolase